MRLKICFNDSISLLFKKIYCSFFTIVECKFQGIILEILCSNNF